MAIPDIQSDSAKQGLPPRFAMMWCLFHPQWPVMLIMEPVKQGGSGFRFCIVRKQRRPDAFPIVSFGKYAYIAQLGKFLAV